METRHRRLASLVASRFAVAFCGAAALMAQQSASRPAVFTAAQAEAGRKSFQAACAKCHTYDLRGRKGEPGENPPVDSLDADAQGFINTYGGKVPQLAGPEFMARWSGKTAAQLADRIGQAAAQFTGDEKASFERSLSIAAYVLQSNGAKAGAQELTRVTADKVGSVAGK